VFYDVSATEYYSTWITDWVLSTELATVSPAIPTPQASTDTYTVLAVRKSATTTEMTTAFTEIKGASWNSATDTLEEIRDALSFGAFLSTTRPNEFVINSTLTWLIESFDLDGNEVDLDGVPSVAVYKNGDYATEYTTQTVSVAAITGTGKYKATFNPAAEALDDVFEFQESGAYNTAAVYGQQWTANVIAAREVMRGTDGANTTVPDAAGTAAGLHSTTDGLITTADTAIDAIATTIGVAGDGLTDLGGIANWSSLVISATGIVEANVQKINDVDIVGDGSGTPFNV